MNLGLEGRVCVVTGGSRGIGAATARMLSQEGAQVFHENGEEVSARGIAAGSVRGDPPRDPGTGGGRTEIA